jgi:dihydropteroate synthase
MASETGPGAQEPINRVRGLLQQSLALAHDAGLSANRVVLDPGIGFFRKAALPWDAWDCEVVRGLGALRALGRPILIALSRKSFIGRLLDRPEPAVAILNGAHMVRTHDVGATRDVIRMVEALRPR